MTDQPLYSVSAAPPATPNGRILGLLRRHLALSLLIVAAALAAGVTALSLLPKEYSAYAMIAIENNRLRSTPSEPLFNDVPLDLFTVRAASELIGSPAVVERVVAQMDLWNDVELVGRADGRRSSLAKRLPELWATVRSVLPATVDRALADTGAALGLDTLWTQEEPALSPDTRRALVIDQFQRRLSVSQVPQSLLVLLQYRSHDPQKAMDVVNAMARSFLDLQLREKVNQLEATAQVLEGITNRFHTRMVQAQSNLKAHLQQIGRLDLGRAGDLPLTFSSQSTSDLNARYLAARTERIEAEARLKELRDANAQSYLAALSIASFSAPMVQMLREQRAQVSRQLANLTTTHGPLHPSVVQMNAQIGEIDRTVRRVVDDLIRSKDNDLKVIRDKEATLARELAAFKEQTREESAIGPETVELMAQSQAARGNYEAFLGHLNKAAGLTELQQPDAKLVKPALVPLDPSFPRPLPILALSVIGGVFVSAGVAWRREARHSGFSSINEVEEIAGTPVLGLLPNARAVPARAALTARRGRRSGFFSAIEHLRLWLSTAMSSEERDVKVVMVASSLPGEGKSTVSWALAVAAAAAGQRVLLIEGDTRKPSRGRRAGSGGLVGVLNGEIPLHEALERDDRSGVDVLPAGPVWHQPIGHAQHRSLQNLILDAAEAFDLVVIDSPPVLAAPDAKVYAPFADRLLFLIRWDVTPPQVASRGLSEIGRAGGHIAGVCITGVGGRDMRRLLRSSDYGYLRYPTVQAPLVPN